MFADAPAARLRGGLLLLQLLACAVAAALLAAPRPSAEAVLLVPLTAQARAALPAGALDGRARLIGAGTLPGSLIVSGSPQSALRWIRRGVVAIAIPLRACATADAS